MTQEFLPDVKSDRFMLADLDCIEALANMFVHCNVDNVERFNELSRSRQAIMDQRISVRCHHVPER